VLLSLPLLANSDDFVFDNEILAQVAAKGFAIGEISCPTKYFPEASSISFWRSVRYGLGVVRTSTAFRLWRWGLTQPTLYSAAPELRLAQEGAAQ
jgi:hypothetical protein